MITCSSEFSENSLAHWRKLAVGSASLGDPERRRQSRKKSKTKVQRGNGCFARGYLNTNAVKTLRDGAGSVLIEQWLNEPIDPPNQTNQHEIFLVSFRVDFLAPHAGCPRGDPAWIVCRRSRRTLHYGYPTFIVMIYKTVFFQLFEMS
jgi:hypothetical protein